MTDDTKNKKSVQQYKPLSSIRILYNKRDKIHKNKLLSTYNNNYHRVIEQITVSIGVGIGFWKIINRKIVSEYKTFSKIGQVVLWLYGFQSNVPMVTLNEK